jgi:hypothetical protein
MADLGGTFDANTIEPNAGFGLIPKGDYDAVIIESERKATKAGDGSYLNLKFQIMNGEYKNRILWTVLNLWNKNDQAVTIAKGDMSAICRAIGVMTPRDSSELHMKPMKISVAVKHNKDRGEDENRIVGYKPRNAGPAATPAPVAANAVPW